MKNLILMMFVALMSWLLVASPAVAETIDLVSVGNPGNVNDTTGYGDVADAYQIGKYEVTNAQYTEFLNAKASVGDPNGLYNADMAGIYGGIDRNGSGTTGDPYVYSAKGGDTNWDNRPVNFVSFWDAARFSNWLHNGQGTGDMEHGAYENIGNQSTFARQSDAKWFIPTENEWYKAAYHKNDGITGNYFDYPTSSDSVPSNDLIDPDPGNNANFDRSIDSPYYVTEVGEFENSDSPYGAFDQGGNLWEWNETAIDSSRGVRGSYWGDTSSPMLASNRSSRDPTFKSFGIGFRVASIPEPTTLVLLGIGALALLLVMRRRQR